ncbi:hypothetical protein FF1_035582 [Malus domestica]
MAANMAKILWFKAANRNHVNSSISQLTTRFLASAPHNYTRRFLGPVSTELKLPRYERMMVANFNSQAATAKPKNIDNPPTLSNPPLAPRRRRRRRQPVEN